MQFIKIEKSVMILIVTYKEDFTTDFVINILNQKRQPYLRLNTEDILSDYKVEIASNSQLNVKIDGIDTFHSVWFRRVKMPVLESSNIGYVDFMNIELKKYFSNLWQTIDPLKWMSHPNAIYRSENKLLQLKIAQTIGLSIPRTLVSYNHDVILDFYDKCNGEIIIKPLYNNRIIGDDNLSIIYTSALTKNDLLKIEESMPFPSIYQEYVDKDIEIRVTVVENEIFSAYTESQKNEESKIDWRRSDSKFYSYKLPDEIEKKCIELIKCLGLSFGAIDLIKNKNGEYTFLEINPNGQWAWIEIDTGMPISKAISNYLIN